MLCIILSYLRLMDMCFIVRCKVIYKNVNNIIFFCWILILFCLFYFLVLLSGWQRVSWVFLKKDILLCQRPQMTSSLGAFDALISGKWEGEKRQMRELKAAFSFLKRFFGRFPARFWELERWKSAFLKLFLSWKEGENDAKNSEFYWQNS